MGPDSEKIDGRYQVEKPTRPRRVGLKQIVVPSSWFFLWHLYSESDFDEGDDNDRVRGYKGKTLKDACAKFARYLTNKGWDGADVSVDYEVKGSDGRFYDITNFENALRAKGYV